MQISATSTVHTRNGSRLNLPGGSSMAVLLQCTREQLDFFLPSIAMLFNNLTSDYPQGNP